MKRFIVLAFAVFTLCSTLAAQKNANSPSLINLTGYSVKEGQSSRPFRLGFGRGQFTVADSAGAATVYTVCSYDVTVVQAGFTVMSKHVTGADFDQQTWSYMSRAKAGCKMIIENIVIGPFTAGKKKASGLVRFLVFEKQGVMGWPYSQD